MPKKGEPTRMLMDVLEKIRAYTSNPYPSERALADAAGIHPQSLWRWLNKGQYPDFNTLSQLLAFLRVRIVFPEDAPYPKTALDEDIRKELAQRIPMHDRPRVAARAFPHVQDDEERAALLTDLISGTVPMTAGVYFQVMNAARMDIKPGATLDELAARHMPQITMAVQEPPHRGPDAQLGDRGEQGHVTRVADAIRTLQDGEADFGMPCAANGGSPPRK